MASFLLHTISISTNPSHKTPSTIDRRARICSAKPYKSMTIVMTQAPVREQAQSQSYWTTIDAHIENHLKKNIVVRPPLTVFEPMHYLAFAAPRTTAAALCIAACELVGGDKNDAVDAAAAIHLMNAAGYTHENLPLTDRVRPKTDIHHEFGPNVELLTGDGIIPFGLELLAKSLDSGRVGADKILRVITEISQAVGSEGLVDGQYREFECTQSSDGNETCHVEQICEKKEGRLHACGAVCGAILGGGTEEEIERLRRFGSYVGMVQGMSSNNDVAIMERVKELRSSAFKELAYFSSRNVEQISSFLYCRNP